MADVPCGNDFTVRPGDDFNTRGDVRAVLQKHGWTSLDIQPGGNEYWRRPGKTEGNSATLKDGVFYVFSSNAAPFKPGHGYSPFHVYSQLEARRRFRNDGSSPHSDFAYEFFTEATRNAPTGSIRAEEVSKPFHGGDRTFRRPLRMCRHRSRGRFDVRSGRGFPMPGRIPE